MSSPPPPPATEETTEEETTDEEEDEDIDQWEESSEDDEEEEEGDEGGRGSAGPVSADVPVPAMVADLHGAEIEAWPTCCVCMEPWTSDGAHRICCIPCGHVYGRSCLEKWLRRCGNTSAKCPQCCQRFRHKHITNLHVSGNVWDDFCRLQLLIQELEARLAVTDKRIEQFSVDVRSNDEENEELKARLAVANSKLERLLVDIRSEVAEQHAKLRAEISSETTSRIDEAYAKLRAQVESIQQSSWEEAARAAAAVVQAGFLSMKEQMRKMAHQHKATPVDLLRFMEHNGAKLWEAIPTSRPPPPPAATTTMEDDD